MYVVESRRALMSYASRTKTTACSSTVPTNSETTADALYAQVKKTLLAACVSQAEGQYWQTKGRSQEPAGTRTATPPECRTQEGGMKEETLFKK